MTKLATFQNLETAATQIDECERWIDRNLSVLCNELPGLFPKKIEDMTLCEKLNFANTIVDFNAKLTKLARQNIAKPRAKPTTPPWPGSPPPFTKRLKQRIEAYRQTLEEDLERVKQSECNIDVIKIRAKLVALDEICDYIYQLKGDDHPELDDNAPGA